MQALFRGVELPRPRPLTLMSRLRSKPDAASPHLDVDGDLAHEVHVVPVDQATVGVAQYGRVERRHILHVRLAGQLRQVIVVAFAQDLALPVPCNRTVI